MKLVGTIDRMETDPNGIPRLIFHVNVRNEFDVKISILSVTTEVRASGRPGHHDVVNTSHFIGYGVLDVLGNHEIAPKALDYWRVGIPLPPYTLKQLEESRGTNDMFFVLKLSYTAAIVEDEARKRYGFYLASSVEHDRHSNSYCVFKVARSDWVKMLSELRYDQLFLCEIPVRGVPTRSGMKKALDHLSTAWVHFEEGRDAETLASCHQAFEYLAKKVGAKTPDHNAFEKLLTDIDDADKRLKLRTLMHTLCSFFHLGRHEQGKPGVAVDRRDAELALVLSQATLSFLARHLQRPAR